METPPPPHLHLSNRIIRQMVDHLFGEDMLADASDYIAMRMVYRQCGGLWERLVMGSPDAISLLEKIVTAWGLLPGRRKKSEENL